MKLRLLLLIGAIPLLDLSAREPLEETATLDYPLVADGSLDVSDVDGSIMLFGWDKPAVRIVVTKRAYKVERLKGIETKVTATPASISLVTSFPPRRGRFGDFSGTVDYVILAPASAKVKSLKLKNGEMLIEGINGSVNAEVGNGVLNTRSSFADLTLTVSSGRIDSVFDWWEPKAFSVRASITTGSIRTVLPAAAEFQYRTKTTDGEIRNEFDPRRRFDETTNARNADGKVGNGGQALFDLKATEGSIAVLKQ